jgi:hypothetical protein
VHFAAPRSEIAGVDSRGPTRRIGWIERDPPEFRNCIDGLDG